MTTQHLTYYGGKTNIADEIISMIPKHDIYVEPFAGSAVVYFNKPLAKINNVINDTDNLLINFYICCQKFPEKIIDELNSLPYSEYIFKEFGRTLRKLDKFKPFKPNIKLAVMYYYTQVNSYGGKGYKAGFGYNKGSNTKNAYFVKLVNMVDFIDKIKRLSIHNRDSLDIIKIYDTENTFYFVDPPYPGSDQGQYKGYTTDDFNKLIELLKTIKGKFILTCYENKETEKIINESNFFKSYIDTKMSVTKSQNNERTETLLRNYNLENTLF